MRTHVPEEGRTAERGQRVPGSTGPALARAALELQRTAGNRATARLLQRTAATPVMNLSVPVKRPMGSRELMVEFAVQARRRERLTRDQARKELAEGKLYWVDGAGNPIGFEDQEAPTVTEEEARQGFKLLAVYAHGVSPLDAATLEERRQEFYALEESEEEEINEQTNDLFWELTGYKVGQKLDPKDAQDKLLAQDWLKIRAHVMGQRAEYHAQPQDLKRLLYDMIPAESRAVMFAPGAKGELLPEDFDAALRVARMIAELSPEERAEYYSRVQGTTTSWDSYELALDLFTLERKERGEAAQTRETAKASLAAYDSLYRAYWAWKDAVDKASKSRGGATPTFNEHAAVVAAMEPFGFESVAEVGPFLQPRISDFRKAFEAEAVHVADEVLGRFRHVLWSETERLTDGDQMLAFYNAIKGAGDDLEPLAEIYPLLRDEELRDKLKGVWSPGVAFDRVRSYAKQRRQAIDRAEKEVHADPNLVYAFDALMNHAKLAAGVETGSIFEDIIKRHKATIDSDRLLKNIATMLLGIAIVVITKGGALALPGALVATGIGAWDTLEEFQRYEIEQAGHESRLLSDEPSKFWLIVSVLGSVGDVAMAFKMVGQLAGAARALDSVDDLPTFTKAYDETVERAWNSGDMAGARALEDARESILAAAKRRAMTLDEQLDDAFKPIDDGPLGDVVPDFSYKVSKGGDEAAGEARHIEDERQWFYQVEREFRIPIANQDRFQEFAEKFKVEIYVRPSSKGSLEHLEGGAIPKPEDIKSKTFNSLDTYLGAPPDAIGKVGFFKPKPPIRPPDLKETDQQWKDIVERFAYRDAEYWIEARKMTELQKAKATQIGTHGEVQIHIDESGVVTEAGSGRVFTGDHDIYEILSYDGSRLSDTAYQAIVAEMKASGLIQHGAHLRWKPGPNEQHIYDDIVRKHESGEEPLARFAPGKEPHRTGAPPRR